MKTANLKISYNFGNELEHLFSSVYCEDFGEKRLSNLKYISNSPYILGNTYHNLRKLQSAHGGSDPGAVYEGRREKDDNLSLAIAVGELLSRQGVSVIYTRTTDVYQTPFEKAQMANQADADFFISFHRNSSEEPNQYTGVETLVYDNSGIKQTMAENINGALSELGFRNLGVKARPGLVVLRRTKNAGSSD